MNVPRVQSAADAMAAWLGGTLPRFLIFAGKGGAGKTTCALSAGLLLARENPKKRFLVASTDPAHSLTDSLAGTGAPENLDICEWDFRASLDHFLTQARTPLARIAAAGTLLTEEEALSLLDLSLPGLDEVLAFADVVRFAEEGPWRTVIADTAPAGHLLRLLESPATVEGWLSALDAMLEKRRFLRQAIAGRRGPDDLDWFVAWWRDAEQRVSSALADPRFTQLIAVAEPDRIRSEGTARLIARVRARGAEVAAVVWNRVRPDAGCVECHHIHEQQQAEIVHLARLLEPGAPPFWTIPEKATEPRGTALLERLLEDTAGPADPAIETAPIRWSRLAPLDSHRLLLFGGKGGVGKTTLAAAAALRLSARGGRTLLISADPAHSLSDYFGGGGSQPHAVSPDLDVLELDAAAELAAFRETLAPSEEAAGSSGSGIRVAYDGEAQLRLMDLSPPGLDELMALNRIAVLLREGGYRRVVVDGAPTGHLMRMLELPGVLDPWLKQIFTLLMRYRDTVSLPRLEDALIRLSRDLREFRKRLSNPAETALIAVTLPVEMAMAETADLLAGLEPLGVPVAGVVVNRMTPERACGFCRAVARRERGVVARAAARFPEYPFEAVPRQSCAIGREELVALGTVLLPKPAQREPVHA